MAINGLIQFAEGKFHFVEWILAGAACAGFFGISHLALAMAIRRKAKRRLG